MINYDDPNPIAHFNNWFFSTKEAHPQIEVNAMSLATIDIDGTPKSRVILLKAYDWEGFVFYTNYDSEKGVSIAHNKNVALFFDWSVSGKNVLIQGHVHKVSESLSDVYFENRPRGSQLGAWVSQQSTAIESREILTKRLQYYENKFHNTTIPKPDNWGGYKVMPQKIEFASYSEADHLEKISYQLLDNGCWKISTKFEINN